MKPSNKTRIVFLFIGLSLSTLSFAQGVASVKVTLPESATYVKAEPESAEDAKASFSSLFPDASEQKWSSADGSSFVSFLHNGRKATASFSPKGYLNYVITTCSFDNLPSAFAKNIKSDYAGYELFHAIEIKAYGETAFQAVLENDRQFVTLKYTADGIEKLKEVKK